MKHDLEKELFRILAFLKIPPDQQRLECLLKHANGVFKRKSGSKNSKWDFFRQNQRQRIHNIILNLNRIIVKRGFGELPLDLYESYNRTEEDQEILGKSANNYSMVDGRAVEENSEDVETTIGGAKLIMAQYIKYYSNDNNLEKVENIINSIDKLKVVKDFIYFKTF